MSATGSMSSPSTGNFLFQIKFFEQLTKDRIDEVCRNSAVRLSDGIVEGTPIDDPPGDDIVARGDWNANVDTEPSDVNNNDPSGGAAKSAIRGAAKKWKPSANETYYLANHKPYIVLLEYGGYPNGPKVSNGHSSQAPNGMVAIQQMKWQQIVAEEARKAAGRG